MSLVISHNLMAANTALNLERHYSRLAVSTQRLGSGLRINSAVDDAAGLAIRELMRADISSLQQGARNANDAISMIQVADGSLGVIDEKLIRMKELAEQAATGTYDSTQRLLIDSEFQAMAAEIDRIANATDFNGIKLLDGSLTGKHDGSRLASSGSMKIHFGSANDSAEDYYYMEIGDCSTKGLGLWDGEKIDVAPAVPANPPTQNPGIKVTLNDSNNPNMPIKSVPASGPQNMQDALINGEWVMATQPGPNALGDLQNCYIFIIPAGTKNVVINTSGTAPDAPMPTSHGDNDIQLFTKDGKHLAGTPADDFVWNPNNLAVPGGNALKWTLDGLGNYLPFTSGQYDAGNLNTGPANYNPANTQVNSGSVKLSYSAYNGMTIGYSGDSDRFDTTPNDGASSSWTEYETLTIDEVTEDLIVILPGSLGTHLKVYWDIPDEVFGPPLNPEIPAGQEKMIDIQTQENAQKALERIDEAILTKDKIRAHLGALQNRLENTVANITIQMGNLQSAESRISDADVATEMTNYVRNQILTQSAVAMLSQANSMPIMALQLIG